MDKTADLIKALSETAEPVKQGRSPLGIFARWISLSLIYEIIMVLISGTRPDLAVKLHDSMFLSELGLLAAIVVTAGLTASYLSFPDMHQKKWVIWSPAIPFVGFASLLYYIWMHQLPQPLPPDTHCLECLICIALFSAFSTIVMMYFLKKQATTHYYTAGAVALLASSSLGALTFALCEPVDTVSHLVTWHYLPLIGFMILGMIFGRKFLRW